jgi:hypothetical protein
VLAAVFPRTILASIEDVIAEYNTTADERRDPHHNGKYGILDRVMCNAIIDPYLRFRVEDLSTNRFQVLCARKK